MRSIALLVVSLFLLSPSLPLFAGEEGGPDGASLYRTHCASCHHSLSRTDKPFRSASRIASSIRYFPAMTNLSALSEEEIQSIAAVLNTLPH